MYVSIATRLSLKKNKMADTSSVRAESTEPTNTEKTPTDGGDSSAAELQKKIAEAFDIFDHESNKTVDVR